ncbi:hypothetical protein Tco_1292787 [Tanacetum coccineum]
MLGAAGVQIPENNLEDLHSSREGDGTSETMDPQDLLGSFLLADKDLIFLGVSVSRAVGFLRVTSVVVVILVKGHAFPTIVKVLPVDLDLARAFTSLIKSRTHKSLFIRKAWQQLPLNTKCSGIRIILGSMLHLQFL